MNNKKYDAVFEGGGVKGVALIGALKRLEEEEIGFGRVAGTSAGAVTAALVSARYKAEEIRDILWNKNFNDFANIFLKRKDSGGFFTSFLICCLYSV